MVYIVFPFFYCFHVYHGSLVNCPHLGIPVGSLVLFPVFVAGGCFGNSIFLLPSYYAFPSICFFPRSSSFAELSGEVFAVCPIDSLSSGLPCKNFSNSEGPACKKMGFADSGAILYDSHASDTISRPTDATTSPGRRRYLHQGRGPHKHRSQGSQPDLETRKLR